MITFRGAERCLVFSPHGEPMEAVLSLQMVRTLLRAARREGRANTVAVFVDGWSEPWLLGLYGGADDVRARCPTSGKVLALCEETVS